mmetsp:Transcript_20690/g.24490  ORF Transcript_20690/g.24490 Transcript_20690/m.24490 type:complete len:300 (-) Transcript_20690:52-951(-)
MPLATPPPSPPLRASPIGMGPSRDLSLAKQAFEERDIALMIKSHDSSMGGQQEQHAGNIGEGLMTNSIKSLIFGGLDGIITTFAIICAAVGADFSHKTVIVMATANLVADAISMGFGDALSEKAEMDFVRREWNRESWEMDENPDGEIKEMVELYIEAGVSEKDAIDILTTMAKYKKFFVEHMMVVELGMMAPNENETTPWTKGAVTFISFVLFGSVPLISYTLFEAYGASQGLLFGMCCFFTMIATFALGAVKGRLASTSTLASGALMMSNGALAAATAYLLGWGLASAVTAQHSSCN